jgi:hypothetical protein
MFHTFSVDEAKARRTGRLLVDSKAPFAAAKGIIVDRGAGSMDDGDDRERHKLFPRDD